MLFNTSLWPIERGLTCSTAEAIKEAIDSVIQRLESRERVRQVRTSPRGTYEGSKYEEIDIGKSGERTGIRYGVSSMRRLVAETPV